MTDISSPEVYFTQVVPQQYAAALAAAPANVADQPELTAVYTITGAGGAVYTLRGADSKIDALIGDQIASPDMRIVMSYDDWRTFAESGATDPFVDYVSRRKVGVVQGLKGTVRLELARSDGSLWQSATTFGGQEEPALTLRMTNDDYRAMLSGELNGQMAFMTGKLKFEGSLPLLMQVGALSS
ncbi:MAG TPA: SCP2 sterol-binding domain-containing protein [Roseiflexaceae bacterium]|nr:SCP2 sterol-binding domain-containing protein [Roseiflexaceae bacterium]